MRELSKLFDLSEKIAFITGGASGIGRTLALGMAEFGCDVVVIDYQEKNRDKVLEELEKRGRKGLFFLADVANQDLMKEVVRKTIARLGKIDILINNAGFNIRKPAVEYNEQEWNRVINTNLKGVFFTTQAVGETMIQRRKGKIINIASVMGLVGSPPYQNVVPYCASKGGVIQLTKSFALEWVKYNIHVNAIAPGYVKTGIVQQLMEDKEKYEMVLSYIPFKRFADPEELIGPAVFLASEASNYMTGHILCVDGGWMAQ